MEFFLGTQERVQNSHGKRVIGFRAIDYHYSAIIMKISAFSMAKNHR